VSLHLNFYQALSFRHWSGGRSSLTKDEHDPHAKGLQYPYVVCNIGSGVSVLVVRGHNDFARVSGSSIGGGFFQGLLSLVIKYIFL
jgi:pantothenate kinase